MLRSLPKASTLLRRLAKFGDDEGLILGAGRAMASGLSGNGVRGASGQSDRGVNQSKQWELLVHQGYDINPCNSPLHPAVIDAGIEPDSEEELPVQEAYTPESACFGCGPAAVDGLHLRSFRCPGGLEASVVLDKKYCAFPGIINGGIVSALFDCHGNWSAAIALMDRGCLPKPPLTLTFELLVTYQEPTPPNENLIVRSQIMKVKDSSELGAKATVQVDMTLHQLIGGHEKLLATASGIFKKLGALRAL
jgi:acyl-coenzyme A thioesterase PaaI-like protein